MSSPILIYGFGPYKEFTSNVTGEIVSQLAQDKRFLCRIFDVQFDREMFEEQLEKIKPKTILGLGQCRSGELLRIEVRARNFIGEAEARLIEANREEFLPVSWKLPVSETCSQSDNAGDYVCNFSMWVVENWARRNSARFAFLHIPHEMGSQSAIDYIRTLEFA